MRWIGSVLKWWVLVTAVVVMVGSLAAAQGIPNYTPVTDQRLLSPEPTNWLMYRGTYNGWGYSPLKEINTRNVRDLTPVWTFSTGVTGGHEAPPIVNNGVMFITAPFNRLYALNAKTGDLYWEYTRKLPDDLTAQHVVNRGVALYGDKVYMATLDSHLLAFDVRTGKIVWDQTVADYKNGYYMTLAPLAVRGKIIVGMSGGETGIRGFVEAYDADTGSSIWKTFTVPAPGQPGSQTWPANGEAWMHGGAGTWMTGSYDPQRNVIFWGVGNPGPWIHELRPGDNLYSDSLLALNADTGAIQRYFQFTPNDAWDYDATTDYMLVDIKRNGQTLPAVATINRNGHLYLLTRDNLNFIYAQTLTTVLSFKEIDPETGRAIVDPAHVPQQGKDVYTCPSLWGPKDWPNMAYDPDTGYLYAPMDHMCMTYTEQQQIQYLPGQPYVGTAIKLHPDPNYKNYGEFAAFDLSTGKKVWSWPTKMHDWGSALATAGGLVFSGGTPDRYFHAFDAKTGRVLWEFRTNSGVLAPASTYEVDGVQYVAVLSGFGQDAAAIQGLLAPQVKYPEFVPQGAVLWVFALKR